MVGHNHNINHFWYVSTTPSATNPAGPPPSFSIHPLLMGARVSLNYKRAPYITNVASMLARSAERTHDYLCLLLLSLLLLLPEPLTFGPTMCFNFVWLVGWTAGLHIDTLF